MLAGITSTHDSNDNDNDKDNLRASLSKVAEDGRCGEGRYGEDWMDPRIVRPYPAPLPSFVGVGVGGGGGSRSRLELHGECEVEFGEGCEWSGT